MEPAIKLALVSCGLFFLTGLVTGIWKYVHIARSPEAQAPAYVDICHRAALLYSFACLVVAKFAELSIWSAAVDFWAAAALIAYFAGALVSYAVHGWLRDTDNQLRRPHVLGRGHVHPALIALFMWSLVAAEVGGFVVLFAGALKTLFPAA
jgi:hypothetical protein